MNRDIAKLTNTQFDVVVIGAGIYGACIAAELSQSGYIVALIEADDFGACTSANTMGILHGGMRYLQHLDLKRMHRSIESRRFFMQQAPQLINVVPFQIPLKGWGLKSPAVMRLALWLNDIISFSRNKGLASNIHIPGSYIAAKSVDINGWFTCVKGLKAIGVWHEAVVSHAERMVLEIVKLADSHGAQIANYCIANRLIIDDQRCKGIQIKDRLSGQMGVIKANWVIDASGFNKGKLRSRRKQGYTPNKNWARAVNAVINGNIIGDNAVTFSVQDKVKDTRNKTKQKERLLFAVPCKNRTLIGTFYEHQLHPEEGVSLSQQDKKRLLREFNRCHQDLNLKADDILYWHSGWLPVLPSKEDELELESHSSISQHYLVVGNNASGLLEVKAVKFTTAPAVAKDVAALVDRHCHTEKRAASKPRKPQYESPSRTIEHVLYARYGKHWGEVKAHLNKTPQNLKPIHQDLLQGEIEYICENEMVCRLSDIMLRRFQFTLKRDAFLALAHQISKIMQPILGWSDSRCIKEIQHLQSSLNTRSI